MMQFLRYAYLLLKFCWEDWCVSTQFKKLIILVDSWRNNSRHFVYVCLWYFAGEELVSDLLHDFLFPASKLMMDNVIQMSDDTRLAEFNPKLVGPS